MYKTLAAAVMLAVAKAQSPPCGKGFFPTVNGCKCIDQWAVPVAGEIDVCQCLDHTSHWNADGTFCKIPNAAALAHVNAKRTQYYPFDTAETRLANQKANLAAWQAKMTQRSKEIREAGFDVTPNPENWHEWATVEWKEWWAEWGKKWHWYGYVPPYYVGGDYVPGEWKSWWAQYGKHLNWYGGHWEPYSPGHWYWNGKGWWPVYNLPWKYWGGQYYWFWGNWWYTMPPEWWKLPGKLDAEHVQRVKDITSTAANAAALMDEAYPLDAKIESVPFSNDFSVIASSTPALNGMSELNPQWQGLANPFNSKDPDFINDATTWPNNDRVPSTPVNLMNVQHILPQMP